MGRQGCLAGIRESERASKASAHRIERIARKLEEKPAAQKGKGWMESTLSSALEVSSERNPLWTFRAPKR